MKKLVEGFLGTKPMGFMRGHTAKVMLAVAACAMCFAVGHKTGKETAYKDFEAACFFSDVLRSYMDEYEDSILYSEWASDWHALGFKSLREEDLKDYYQCY